MSFSTHYNFSSMCPYVAINIYDKLLTWCSRESKEYIFNTDNKYSQIIIH